MTGEGISARGKHAFGKEDIDITLDILARGAVIGSDFGFVFVDIILVSRQRAGMTDDARGALGMFGSTSGREVSVCASEDFLVARVVGDGFLNDGRAGFFVVVGERGQDFHLQLDGFEERGFIFGFAGAMPGAAVEIAQPSFLAA